MNKYKIFTTMTDWGPYVTKLILELPCEIRGEHISPDSFNVYVERKDMATGEIIKTKVNFFDENSPTYLSKGYRSVQKAYPCDAMGNAVAQGHFAALELAEEDLGKRTEGTVLSSAYVLSDYRITLLHALNVAPVVSGLVFDEYSGDVCPQLDGWDNGQMDSGDMRLKYGYYTPKAQGKLPLVIWLHGAGEGGQDPKIAYTGNKAVNISSAEIQGKLGGAAWVLVPQCPTVWMDDGKEQLGRSNISIYSDALKQCIDGFVEAREERIDRDRIYIGGCSNGGFMTVRMVIDNPGYFAAAFPACEAFFNENITDAMVAQLKTQPMWLVHAKGDELVNPLETAVPLYNRLMAAGADNVHFTYFNRMEDLTGMYKDEYGRPKKYFRHGVWIHVYNDDVVADYDGRYVMYDGVPVTLWEWMGKQKR